MAPRSVLYLHTTSEVGGSDVSLVHLVERLDPARYRAVVALPADGPLVGRLQTAGARVRVVPAMKKLTSRRGKAWLALFACNYPRGVAALAKMIGQDNIDVVHTNTIHNLYGWAAARLMGVPHVWHIREIVWQSAALRAIERWLALHGSTRVIVTSDAVGEMFERSGVRPAMVVRIENGVDTDRFAPGAGDRVRQELLVPAGAPLVGAVARLDVWKGLDDFIDAAARIREQRPDARFVIAGGPIAGLETYEETLKRRARARGLDGLLHFAGWRYGPEEMPDLYRALDVSVLPSRQPEPFGLVVLEAMACARPVIATAHGGPLDIVRHGETGLLVEPGNPAAVADAVVELLADPARARAMGDAGRARVLAHYGIDRTVTRVQALYDELGRTA